MLRGYLIKISVIYIYCISLLWKNNYLQALIVRICLKINIKEKRLLLLCMSNALNGMHTKQIIVFSKVVRKR